MTKQLGVLIIHGMGRPDADYADKLIKNLDDRLGARAGAVAYEACHWSPVLQEHQDRIWEKTWKVISQNPVNLATTASRPWAVHYLGDPATYLSGFFKDGRPVYQKVHETVRESLARLAEKLGDAHDKPLVVLAHSLGSIIITNYFWDETQGKDAGIGQNSFEKLETLTSLITYGAPIPIFLPPVSKITCIQFPSPQLPERLKSVASWLNIYDRDDIVAYPLNTLWDEAQGTHIEDVEINVGNPIVSWNFLSHLAYNDDKDFLDLVQKRLEGILDAIGVP